MQINVKNSEEFVESGRISLIPVPKNSKNPGNSWNKLGFVPYNKIANHDGNCGVLIGYNHKENGNSVACIDIDGFKFNEANENLLAPAKLKELSESDKEDITLKTKECIFEVLKEAFPKALHVRTQSGGYHIYVFNKVIIPQQHITSKSLDFPEDFEIESFRRVNLGASIEIFTKPLSKQCIFAGSKVDGNTYKLLNSGVDDWEDVEIVDNVNAKVQEALIDAGFIKHNDGVYSDKFIHITGNSMIDTVSSILKDTRGEHNTCLLALSNVISEYYSIDTTKKIIFESLEHIKDATQEHIAQVNYALKDNRTNKYGWYKISTLLKDGSKLDDLKMELESDSYINMDNVAIVKKNIESEGFVPYITRLLDIIMIGDKKPFLRLYLGSYYVISGLGSVIIEVVAESEDGKSFQFYLLNRSLPNNSFEDFNEITPASFIRMGDSWNNKIIYFGDQGAENSDEKMEEVINIVKTLITEGKYRKLVCDAKLNAEDLSINVDSIGAYYETTHTDMFNNDSQLETRKISVTPDNVDKHEIIKRKGLLRNPNSKYSKDYKTVEKELTRFKDFVKYLISQPNNIVISHFTSNMDKYCEVSDKIVRSFEQQMNLFLAYCTFTQNECIKYNNVLLATNKQFNDFLEFVADASTLNTIEYEFIQMLLNKGFVPEDKVDHYFEAGYEEVINGWKVEEELQQTLNTFSMDNLEILPDNMINKIVKFMVKQYGVFNSELPVFFTVKTLKEFRRLKAYKNVSNLSALLNHLYELGFLDKLDYQRRIGNTNENIYYLTDKVLDLDKFSNNVYEQYSDDDIINMYDKEVEGIDL